MGGIDPNDSEELFVQLFAANERHLRAFIRSMGLGWTEVDDVVQTVSLVMWRKWSEFEPGSDFLRWSRVIARFEVLKFRRTMARDRHVFREDLMELLAQAAEEEEQNASLEYHRTALTHCLDSLPDQSRELIQQAYQGDQTIRDLATMIGKSDTALYKALNRIRLQLQSCIERRLNRLEGAAG